MLSTASRRAAALTPKARSAPSQFFSTRSIPNRPRPTTNIRASNNAQIPASLRPIPLGLAPFQQARHMGFSQRMKRGFQEASKGIWRKNPVLLPLAVLSLAGATVLFAYIAYVEYTRVAPQYHKFPPPVAESLRTAVYYTEVDLNPPKALQSYKEALRIAMEMGMHPFSDEVLGIKLQVAMMLEKAGLVKPAVDVLERTKSEALHWIEEGRKTAAVREKERKATEGKVDKVQVTDPATQDLQQQLKEFEEFEERQRDKALKKAVGIAMKLADLYRSDYIQDDKKAEQAQEAAVELCLKELQRRQAAGLPVGGGTKDNDAWLNLQEIATALNDLADNYYTNEAFDLALPLYIRALDLLRADEGDSPSCYQAHILNSAAGAMAGQAQNPIKTPEPAKARAQLFDAAQKWAEKSVEVSQKIRPPIRDEICDETCVAAMCNLGEIAEMQNKTKEAKKRYTEALALAQKLQMDYAIEMVQQALDRVSSAGK